MISCKGCGAMLSDFGAMAHVCPASMKPAQQWPPLGAGLGMSASDHFKSQLESATKAERDRCVSVIDKEIQRVRDLLNVRGIDGKPLFNEGQTEAGIAALEHAKRLILGEEK